MIPRPPHILRAAMVAVHFPKQQLENCARKMKNISASALAAGPLLVSSLLLPNSAVAAATNGTGISMSCLYGSS